ncbi:hypothetical protein GCM10017600_57070 [Streptosporangium carneum]|uniref:Uncharacterized protein n=1 Tax=Streptosporangium carneum TaxID=47481 RepID=A0A9W6MFW0_9ACTN|nr:hypothetical protein GCM10017600_57070 [Streptosporangium carneum]
MALRSPSFMARERDRISVLTVTLPSTCAMEPARERTGRVRERAGPVPRPAGAPPHRDTSSKDRR